MAVNLNYPSPTAMGIGKLIIDNGDGDGPGTAMPPPSPDNGAAPHPIVGKKLAFAIPNAASLHLANGDDYKAVLLKEVS